jgi:hypothetical protein
VSNGLKFTSTLGTGQLKSYKPKYAHFQKMISRNEVNQTKTVELKHYSSKSGFCQGRQNHSVLDATTLWKMQRKRDSDLERKTIGISSHLGVIVFAMPPLVSPNKKTY